VRVDDWCLAVVVVVVVLSLCGWLLCRRCVVGCCVVAVSSLVLCSCVVGLSLHASFRCLSVHCGVRVCGDVSLAYVVVVVAAAVVVGCRVV